MTRLEWGQGPRMYDLGVDRGVLYLDDSAVPWNGLVSIDEKASGEVNTDYYFEGNRLHISQETGDFEAAIAAYTYPDVFAEYNGYSERQRYRRFGFSYRTQHGQDHRVHLIYNALISEGARTWSTLSSSVDPSLFAWELTASAADIPGSSPAAHLILEIQEDSTILDELENILYGSELEEPRLPDPDELYELYESLTQLRIVYNGDGTYTASGPDDMVTLLSDGRFTLTAPTVFLDDQDVFTVSSY